MLTTNDWFINGLTFCGIILCCISIQLLTILYKCCRFYRTILEWNRLAIFTIISILVVYVNLILDFYHIMSSYITGIYIVDPSFNNIIAASDAIYYISNVIIYIVLILRVYYTFRRTMYAMTASQIIFLSIIIAVDLTAIVFFTFYISSFYTKFSGDKNALYEMIGALIFDTINDLTVNITLLYLFLSKLRATVVNLESFDEYVLSSKHYAIMVGSRNMTALDLHGLDDDYNGNGISNYNNYNNSNNNNIGTSGVADGIAMDIDTDIGININIDVNLDEKQRRIVNLMTKVSLLAIIAALFSQGWNFIAGFNVYTFATNGNDESQNGYFTMLGIISYIIRSSEGIVNCTVLYLMFVFNEKEYYICCGRCHACLYNGCVRSVKSKIDKKIKKTITSMSPTRKSSKELNVKLLDA